MTTATTDHLPDGDRHPVHGFLDRLERRLRAPIDIASLVAFRMMFGTIVVWEVYRYATKGWIDSYWVDPEFHFHYLGFGWVEPLPATGMWALFGVLAVCGTGIAVGAWYRLCTVVFFVVFSYVFLLEAARYLNHFYLFCLLGLLLSVVPAHRRWSVDAALHPARRTDTVPTWSLWLLRAQVGIVYLYGGLAKIDADWLRGEPMRTWLAANTDVPIAGRFFDEDWAAFAASWGGLAFDLLIIPAVLWRRTRVPALLTAVAFHLLNRELFSIGVFPYLALAGLLLFCQPSWPRDLLRRIGVGSRPVSPPGPRAPRWARAGFLVLALHLAVQALVPLRHHLYEGRPNWTEGGHWFAWHMKLRSKWGDANFVVRDPATGQTWSVDPATILTPLQEDKMAIRPELIRQFSVEIADRYRDAGHGEVEVYAHVYASLNGRPPELLVDPTVDLADEPARIGTPPWVLPMTEPLPAPTELEAQPAAHPRVAALRAIAPSRGQTNGGS